MTDYMNADADYTDMGKYLQGFQEEKTVNHLYDLYHTLKYDWSTWSWIQIMI